jgi:hypothetical protein
MTTMKIMAVMKMRMVGRKRWRSTWRNSDTPLGRFALLLMTLMRRLSALAAAQSTTPAAGDHSPTR